MQQVVDRVPSQVHNQPFSAQYLINSYLEILRETLKDSDICTEDVLCLGLGSPTTSRDARIQLAYLFSMCEEFNIVGALPTQSLSLGLIHACPVVQRTYIDL